jgi:hypothetical protein
MLAEIHKIKRGCFPRGFHYEPDYRATTTYVREMKRYGVLPPEFEPDMPLDPWKVDQDYYEEFYPEAQF